MPLEMLVVSRAGEVHRRFGSWGGTLAAALLALALASCDDAVAPPDPDPPEDPPVVPELTLRAAGADSVDAIVATTVSLSVRVEDLEGTPYEGATVRWQVDNGGGTITSAAETTSDATGHAGAAWSLGTVAGAQGASARIDSRENVIVVDFVAVGLAGPAVDAFLVADSVLLGARGETVYLSPSFEDQFGNSAVAVGVTWESTDDGVASVAADGLVTGQQEGAAYIRMSLGSPTDSILVTVQHRGAITITFDDGWLTTYAQAWPVLQSFDLVANVAVYTGVVGAPEFMDLAQLQELDDAGWTMVSHSVSHDSLTTLTERELDYELRISQRFLTDNGLERGSDIFIVPYHHWTERERNAVAEYYAVARGTSSNAFVPDSLVSWQPTNPYDLTGIDVEQLPFTTAEGRDELRTLLQRTLDEGKFLDVVFHQIPEANVQAFIETLTIINDFRERVRPYHELYPEFARVVF